MNPTQATLAYDLLNLASSGSNPIDFRIERSQVNYWIDQTRSMLISQAIQKKQDVSDVWLQTIGCEPLIEVDKSECCEITTSCVILRTTNKIPNTIEVNGDNFINRIQKPNGDIISKTNPFKAKYDSYNKYTGSTAGWYIKNGYIYIINEDFVETVSITGVFESPSELANFTTCSGVLCFAENQPYPCSMKMANEITNIILKTKIYPYIQLPQDTTNNANDNPNNNVPNKL